MKNRTYLGDAPHKGIIHRGGHEAIVPRDLWDRVHAVLAVAPRARAGQSRNQTPALLKGLIVGLDGRALSPSHTMRKGRQYRYYVSQSLQKGSVDLRSDLVRALADEEGVKPSYAAGVLRLTLPAPAIVEAILDGRQAAAMTLDRLLKSFPIFWTEQSGIPHGV